MLSAVCGLSCVYRFSSAACFAQAGVLSSDLYGLCLSCQLLCVRVVDFASAELGLVLCVGLAPQVLNAVIFASGLASVVFCLRQS